MENNTSTQKTYNMLKTVNKYVIIIMTIIALILSVGYISNYRQGHNTLPYTVAVNCIVVINLICSYVVYLRKHDSPYFKIISMVGYIVMYTVAVLGSKNDGLFMIAFPIAVIYILYFDYKLIITTSLSFAMVNIIHVFYYATNLKHMPSGAPLNSTSILLQVACIIMFFIILCATTRISNQNNNRKMKNINDEKEKSSQLLQDVLSVVEAVKQNCTSAESYIQELGHDVETTAATLDQISEGNSSNANSIEKQTTMTSNIQEMILSTKQMADDMLVLAQQSESAVKDGQQSMNTLETQACENITANEQVVHSVSALIENAKEVEAITEQIFSISSQTNLLALNASIESARAGEAGKGFAVVADHIRELADETRKLTEMIQKIVEHLRNNADNAKTTVDLVMESVNAQQNHIQDASNRFNGINRHMSQLNENIQNTYQQIEEILQSNNAIVDSINHISSVSQEISASTQQVVALGESTKDKAIHAEKLMTELTQTVKMVDKYL